jgi:hypothetical protein
MSLLLGVVENVGHSFGLFEIAHKEPVKICRRSSGKTVLYPKNTLTSHSVNNGKIRGHDARQICFFAFKVAPFSRRILMKNLLKSSSWTRQIEFG